MSAEIMAGRAYWTSAEVVNPSVSDPIANPIPAPSPPAIVTAVISGGAMTTVNVKADVGPGNAVFLRGDGDALTWERGVPLECVDGKIWRWSGMVKSPVNFKPLINDRVWSAGGNFTMTPGQKLEVEPQFN